MPSPTRLLWIVAALALIAARPPQAGAQPICPSSELRLATTNVIVSTSAAAETTDAASGTVCLRAGYDLVAGRVRMVQCGFLSHTYAIARDAYDVIGVPSGTPVSLTVEFALDGSVWTPGCGGAGCSGTLAGYLRHGGRTDEGVYSIHLFQGSAEVHDVLRLPLTIVAGQPQAVEFELRGYRNPGGSHGSEGTGTIRFTGLPPGARVVSCQGFAGQATPVRSATWGRVKTIYR